MKRAATDVELVLSARTDAASLEELVRRYRPMIAKLASGFANLRTEDALFEGDNALVEAIMHFDPQRGTRFATYAYVCVRNRLARASRAAQATEGLERVPETASALPSPEDVLLQEEALAFRNAEAKRKLSRYEYAVWRMRIDGYSYAEIAVALSTDTQAVTIKSVNNALVRVRNKLKRQA